MVKTIIFIGNACWLGSLLVIAGLFGLLLANIVITIVGVGYHTVLSFLEIVYYLAFNLFIFVGLTYFLARYETLTHSR